MDTCLWYFDRDENNIPFAKPGCNEMEFKIREDFELDLCPYCGKLIMGEVV